LEDNPASDLTLAEKRRALDEYRTKWDTLNPIQKWEREVADFDYGHQASGHGVCGFVADTQKFIEFLTLKSVSRGIPRKEWKLPLPEFDFFNFAIYPPADALAVVERRAG